MRRGIKSNALDEFDFGLVLHTNITLLGIGAALGFNQSTELIR